jgi:predicted ATPase
MTDGADRISFRSGRVVVEPRARRVTTPAGRVRISGRAFELLVALIERRDRLTSKQELMDLLWPGLVVEENNLQVHVWSLRKLLGADAIVTVSGRGYRLVLDPDPSVPTAVVAPGYRPGDVEEIYGGPLVGRDDLVGHALALLALPQSRLLTLTGPGGVGKTRFAVELLARLATASGRPVTQVWLATVAAAPMLPAALADSLGMQHPAGGVTVPQLVEWLREHDRLLLLDNVEHLAMPVAEMVTALLDACPRLTVIATGRVALRLPLERELQVPPLAAPVEDASPDDIVSAPAAALFLQRAREIGRDPAARADELRAAAAICRRLDGLPLALELAAARLRLMSASELLRRLEKVLPMLAGGSTGRYAHQRTLEATIDWSYQLLVPGERVLFRQLSVFAGGAALVDFEAVVSSDDAGTSLMDRASSLLDQSLLRRDDTADDGEPRLVMLETIREFAAARLAEAGEDQPLRQRHARHFLQLAEQAEPHLRSGDRLPWLRRLRAERNNLRAAFDWFTDGIHDVGAALRMAGALTWFWNFDQRLAEGREFLRRALALPEGDAHAAARAAAMSGAARLAAYSGDLREAEAMAAEAVAGFSALGDAQGLGYAMIHHGLAAMPLGADGPALERLEEAAHCLRTTEDSWGLALTITLIGVAWTYRDPDSTGARAHAPLAEGRARFRALGDRWGMSLSSAYLGTLALRAGETAAAREFAQEMLEDARELGDQYRIARTLHQLAEIALAEGDVALALPLLRESVALNVAQQRRGDAAQQLRRIAGLYVEQDRPERALRLLAAAAAQGDEGRTLPAADPALELQTRARLRAAVGDARYEALWALGSGLSLAGALTLLDDA